jgi:adenylate cyclase
VEEDAMQAQASFHLVADGLGIHFGGSLPDVLTAGLTRSSFTPVPVVRKRCRPDVDKYERRLAAVALADVVGYTRMMSEDEDATVRSWLSVRHDILEPIARVFGGRLANTVGDSALAEFRDAVDALAWSRDVQAAMRTFNATARDGGQRFELRIAVHVCEVVVAGMEIYGDGINVAARLQAHAPPGGLIISEAVYNIVRLQVHIETHHLGALQLKNLARPVSAYLIDLRSTNLPRFGLPSVDTLVSGPQGQGLPGD